MTILTTCNSKTGDKNNLEISTWKFSEGKGQIGDILVFDKEHLYVKNDSIYFYNNKSLIGVIDTIKFHYEERRLYVKDLNGNVMRYCEQ